MKIYTKTGDKGETSLFGGQRVSKDNARIDAYGTVDELNSILGLVRSDNVNAEIDRILEQVQNTLFVVGGDLATPRSAEKQSVRRIESVDAMTLEETIDSLENQLKPLHEFVLPGGLPTAARLHVARTVCRRAERAVVRLSRNQDVGEALTVYLNRLSDMLFVLARYANHIANVQETKWKA